MKGLACFSFEGRMGHFNFKVAREYTDDNTMYISKVILLL